MTRAETMTAAIVWSQGYPYIADPPDADVWETLREMVRAKGCDCDGHAFACLQRFAESCEGPVPPCGLVLGSIRGGPEGQRHLWIEIELDGALWWGDPTPGYTPELHPVSWWARTPEWGWAFNPVDRVPILPGYAYQRS